MKILIGKSIIDEIYELRKKRITVIAIVLFASFLLVYTLTVEGVVKTWLTGSFASTQTFVKQSETDVYCRHAGIAMADLKYCIRENGLSGTIKNTDLNDLGSITLHIVYQNASSQTIYLSEVGNARMGWSMMALPAKSEAFFSVYGISSNYDRIHLSTNCTNVYDDATRSDVESVC